MHTTVFTSGDINGIGPEIVLKTINKIRPQVNRKVIFVVPENIFLNTQKLVKPLFDYKIVNEITAPPERAVTVLNIGKFKQSYKRITKISGEASYLSINNGLKLLKDKLADSIVTAPISKAAFQKAGISFPGHTELLADYFGIKKFVMMFVSKKMKAGLITIHIPIKSIPQQLSNSKIKEAIRVIYNSLKHDFNIENPRISILGLNPHAGEGGKIGFEEIDIIKPSVKSFKKFVRGPFVPDAYFGNQLFKEFDCTIGIYHDQILIPFKLLNFNRGVNFTAGLPIIRTSPDHGTAFDIAGEGLAEAGSMIEAYHFAQKILKNRRANIAEG